MTGSVIALLDFVQTRGLPTAAVRARIALDVAESESSAASASAPRVTIASVEIDVTGRAHAPGVASHGHLATLLWEILAGRPAESDELPWSDPGDDLPAGVLDVFASLTLRPAKDLAELRRRFAAGIRSHVASHDEVARSVAEPQPTERITLRAPPVQIEALRTLSAGEQATNEAGIVTRVCPVVTLPVSPPVVVEAPVEEPPRSTLDPWAAAPLGVEVFEITETSAALPLEPEMPQRRRTWPVVAACLVAALVLIGLAGRQRIATATSPAAEAPAAQSPATQPAATQPADTQPAVTMAAASSTSAAPVATIVASASASQTPTIKLPPRVAPRFQGAPFARLAQQPIEQAAPQTAPSAAAPPDVAPFSAPAAQPAPQEPTPVE